MVDVLIIGAGPVGLTMAAQCLRYNIPFRIIEKRSGPSKESRALAIHAKTLELLHFLGIIKKFTNKGLKIKKGLIYFNGNLKINLDLTKVDSPYPYILSLDQSDTEKILEKHIENNNVKVERNKELISLSKKGVATVNFFGKKERIHPKYIIACDGAHSTVRHALKIGFKGRKYDEHLVLADLKVKFPQKKSGVNVFTSKSGIVGFFPLAHKNRFRLIATIPSNTKSVSLEKLREITYERSFIKIELSKPIWISLFNIHKRVVPKMKYENVFLLGDAAHIYSPVGGQGMNIGMHETGNLAWKIKLVLNGASENLLETYNEERYPIVKDIIQGTDIATKIALSENPVMISLKSLIFPVFNMIKPIKKAIVKKMSELLINYDGSSIIFQDWDGLGGVESGHRAPDVKITLKNQLFDLLKSPKHCILVFGDKMKFKHFSNMANIYSLDNNSKAAKVYGIKEEGVYIIRPDGYIGYRSNTLNIKGCEGYFEKLMR